MLLLGCGSAGLVSWPFGKQLIVQQHALVRAANRGRGA